MKCMNGLIIAETVYINREKVSKRHVFKVQKERHVAEMFVEVSRLFVVALLSGALNSR